MKLLSHRLLDVLVVLSILVAGSTAPAVASPWQDKVDPWVLQTAAEGEAEFLVYLTAQADLSEAKSMPTKLEKGLYVYETLSALAESTQAPLIAQLRDVGVEYRPYWIANLVWVRGNLSTVQLLAERLDVAHIYANPKVKLDAPDEEPAAGPRPEGIEWNILKVNADEVWALGFTGQGVVIGGQDTGYDWDHPAIINQYRGWDGMNADHDYNWIDFTYEHEQTPVDPYGHGTHTMGTMVGDDGGSNQIGMAPGARWIGCRNMDDGGNGTPETYIGCYQWFVAPTRRDGSGADPALAPDVINNSWGCPPSEGCTDPNVLLTATENLVAAGIVSAHSAGNSGSSCSSVQDPAAIYDVSFTVGATDSADVIAGFSSRGPVTVDGSNRPKPDISAPGVNVRSCVPGSGYGSYSGTSMAGPHVAGQVALLISAHPSLRGQVEAIENTITQTALHIPWTDCNSSGVPNNVYGWGRIDALAAIVSVHQLELAKEASTPIVSPGELITYTLSVTHSLGAGATTNVVLSDTLPAGTTFVSATEPYTQLGDDIRWDIDSLEAQASVSVEMVVSVELTATQAITNAEYVVHSDQVGMVYGTPVVTEVLEPSMLVLEKTVSAAYALPGDVLTYTLSITNPHASIANTNVVLSDTLPLGTEFISATEPYTRTGEMIRWDFASLEAGGSRMVQLVVRVSANASGMVANDDYAVVSDKAARVVGEPVSTLIGRITFLPMVVKGP
jgi:serine protease AprX